MYINFKSVFDKGFTPQSLCFLQAVHQQKNEDIEDVVAMLIEDDVLNTFLKDGLIKHVKGKKDQSEISRLRTTPKGRDLLISLQKDKEWDEDDEKIVDWLIKVYSKKPNYVKGNNTEAKRRCHWFKTETNITKNSLAKLITLFLNDSFVDDPTDKRPFGVRFGEFKKDNPRAVLSNKIENLFWTPKDNFARYYTLEYSPLWRYYNDNKQYIEEQWKLNP